MSPKVFNCLIGYWDLRVRLWENENVRKKRKYGGTFKPLLARGTQGTALDCAENGTSVSPLG